MARTNSINPVKKTWDTSDFLRVPFQSTCPLAVLLKGAFWDIQAHHALSCSAQLLLPDYHTVTHIDREVPYHTVS